MMFVNPEKGKLKISLFKRALAAHRGLTLENAVFEQRALSKYLEVLFFLQREMNFIFFLVEIRKLTQGHTKEAKQWLSSWLSQGSAFHPSPCAAALAASIG